MASTEVTPNLVKAEPDQRSYILSLTIENGPQYRVRTLQVLNATVFEPASTSPDCPVSSGVQVHPGAVI
jgi:outer membrane protein assembly factor BamA